MFGFPSEEDQLESEVEIDTDLRFSAERHPERHADVDASDPDWFSGR